MDVPNYNAFYFDIHNYAESHMYTKATSSLKHRPSHTPHMFGPRYHQAHTA